MQFKPFVISLISIKTDIYATIQFLIESLKMKRKKAKQMFILKQGFEPQLRTISCAQNTLSVSFFHSWINIGHNIRPIPVIPIND